MTGNESHGDDEPVPESVMASLDAADGEERLVIADVERDGAWVAMDSGGARALAEWV